MVELPTFTLPIIAAASALFGYVAGLLTQRWIAARGQRPVEPTLERPQAYQEGAAAARAWLRGQHPWTDNLYTDERAKDWQAGLDAERRRHHAERARRDAERWRLMVARAQRINREDHP